MFKLQSNHLWLACVAAAVVSGWGCAVSESLDLSDAASSGAGGDSVIGPTGGASGNGSGSGGGGTAGTAGVQGAGIAGASGLAGVAGEDGAAGGAGGGRGGNSGAGGGRGAVGGNSGGRGGTSGGTSGASGGGGKGGHASSPDASTAPTFTEIYKTILIVYCSGSGCHDPGTSGGLGFATQVSALAALSHQVTPGDGADSDLYVTLNDGVMPKGKPKLSASNIALIEEWIDAGALNN
jgi:hypothetical protein